MGRRDRTEVFAEDVVPAPDPVLKNSTSSRYRYKYFILPPQVLPDVAAFVDNLQGGGLAASLLLVLRVGLGLGGHRCVCGAPSGAFGLPLARYARLASLEHGLASASTAYKLVASRRRCLSWMASPEGGFSVPPQGLRKVHRRE